MKQSCNPIKPMLSRRETLKNLVSIPVLGLFGSLRSQKVYGSDSLRINQSEIKRNLPKGKIGNLEITRLIMGGNQITGSAHARDLKYVSKLFKAYNSERKVFETLQLAEKAGINTISIGFTGVSLVAEYKKQTQSKMQVFGQVGVPNDSDNIYGLIEQTIDYGVDALQVVGYYSDWCVRDKRLDVIDKMLNKIRSEGYVAGLGAHTIDTLITCEENGIIPDYYMTTMHHDNYWSAHPLENRKPFEVDGKRHLDHNLFHDNCFCLFPERTVEFVNRIKTPVVGYKVLAAGAIDPPDGFNWAFENGADFICVGMFDFQIEEDVNIFLDTLANLKNRKREWFA